MKKTAESRYFSNAGNKKHKINSTIMRKPLELNCTIAVHNRLGVHAVINARGGNQHLNAESIEEIEMKRDARRIQEKISSRIRVYQFNSKHFRKAVQV